MKDIEIDNAIFQDLDSFGIGKFFKIAIIWDIYVAWC